MLGYYICIFIYYFQCRHHKTKESDRNLGSWFNAHMRMNVHMGKICSKAFRGLYNIRQIRKFLTVESTKTLIHAFVSSHLDYCNALLFGLPKYQLDRLQKVQNAAARVIFQIAKFDHITPALIDLHWLPVTFTGLKITAGQRTMSGLIKALTGQTFDLPVMLTGQN